jgi:hypothetical protein
LKLCKRNKENNKTDAYIYNAFIAPFIRILQLLLASLRYEVPNIKIFFKIYPQLHICYQFTVFSRTVVVLARSQLPLKWSRLAQQRNPDVSQQGHGVIVKSVLGIRTDFGQ